MKQVLHLVFCMLIFSASDAQIMVHTITEEFNGSGGVKVGPDGWLYIGDFGAGLQNSNGTMVSRMKPPDGQLEVFATGLQGASGNAFDSQGNFYQANIGGGHVSKITPDGTVSTYAASGISCPVGVVLDAEDNLYVCNCCGQFENRIQKVTPDGTSTVFASGPLFNCPNGITMDQEGNFYVSNFGNGRVIKITAEGTPSSFVIVPNGNNGHLAYSPADSMLYIASHGASRVYRATLDGNLSILAGSGIRGNDDGPALEATFSRPNGVALSPDGDTLYLNSSIPTTDVNFPLNPSVIRMITGLRGGPITDSKEASKPAIHFDLSPNPVKNELLVQYELKEAEQISIEVYSLNGQLNRVLMEAPIPAGQHQHNFDLKDLPAGVYLLSIRSARFWESRRVIVL